MCLFAIENSDAGWIALAVIGVPVLVKAFIDISGNRFSQKQSEQDKTIAHMQIVVEHTTNELVRLEDRLEKEKQARADEINECRESHSECERKASWLERELIRNGITIRPCPPPLQTDSGLHDQIE